jgi:K+-sensing histidine kinase KdpD
MKHNLNAFRWCPNKAAGYLNAVIGVFFAFCVRMALQPQIEDALPLFFFQINTILIAFCYGTGPAILTVALSIPLMSYFFMAPFGEFSVIDSRDVRILFVYATYTFLVCFLVEWLRREQYNSKMAMLVSESRFKLMVEGDNKIRELLKNTPPQT